LRLVELALRHDHEVEPSADGGAIGDREEDPAAAGVEGQRLEERARARRNPQRPFVEVIGASRERRRRIGPGQPRSPIRRGDEFGLIRGQRPAQTGEGVLLRQPWDAEHG